MSMSVSWLCPDYLKLSIVESHQNTLVVLFLQPAGGWRWVGGWIKGSRVLFHYPIDADLPPSQFSLLLKTCFSVSVLCFCALRSWQLHRSALSLTGGIMVLLQSEEKDWCWYSSVGVRRWGVRLWSSAAEGFFCGKLLGIGGETIRCPLTQSEISATSFSVKVWIPNCCCSR